MVDLLMGNRLLGVCPHRPALWKEEWTRSTASSAPFMANYADSLDTNLPIK